MTPRAPSNILIGKPPRVLPPPQLPSSYSFLLDLPPPVSPFPYKQNRKERPPSVVDWTLRSKVSTGPVRRCLITQQLRYTDVMIQFKAARPASSIDDSTSTSSPQQSDEATRRYFVPTNLLHPRFSVEKDGRGAWITCWKAAVHIAALKRSYKRLSPSLAMPSRTVEQITSQLAHRIAQEFTMFCERTKSRQPFLDGQREFLNPCPVVEFTTEEVARVQESGIKAVERESMCLVAMVSFESRDAESPFSSLLPSPPKIAIDTAAIPPSLVDSDPTAPSLPADLSINSIPFYHLSNFFASIVSPPALPPVDAPPTEQSHSPPSTNAGLDLLVEIRKDLDQTIRLFSKRSRTPQESSSASDQPTPSLSGVYGIYSTISTNSIGDQTPPPSDAIPLLLALRRVRLWTGEGWSEGEQKEMIVEAKLGKKKLEKA